jgi:hypothetical protein
MTRLTRLLLLAAWIVGAVTGGLTVQPDAPAATDNVRVVAETSWARLTTQGTRVVLTVGRGDHQWRAAAPLPTALRNGLREAGDTAPGARRAPPESASFIPL